MTEEIIATRIIKGWSINFTINVIKELDLIRLKEAHTGSVSKEHCAEVVISLTRMDYSWNDRRGKGRVKSGFDSYIALFREAEDKFIILLSKHLKAEYGDREVFAPSEWKTIRLDIKRALRQFIPEKELKERMIKRDKESVLNRLQSARRTAKVFDYSHIASELTRLIEEVKG